MFGHLTLLKLNQLEILLPVLSCVLISVAHGHQLSSCPGKNDSLASCPSFCNKDGHYTPGETCDKQEYCCGNSTWLFCCNDCNQKIHDRIRDVCICEHSSCMIFQWHSIFGVVTASFLVLVVIICCCKCCLERPCCKKPSGRGVRLSRLMSNHDIDSVSARVAIDPSISGFDPSNPYAFKPPDYETVTQGLPRYEDIENNQELCDLEGHHNSMYELIEQGSPPPLAIAPTVVELTAVETPSLPASEPPTYIAVYSNSQGPSSVVSHS